MATTKKCFGSFKQRAAWMMIFRLWGCFGRWADDYNFHKKMSMAGKDRANCEAETSTPQNNMIQNKAKHNIFQA